MEFDQTSTTDGLQSKDERVKFWSSVKVTVASSMPQNALFTRESSYCFQRVLAIAILSICPSHGWISQKWCKL